ncbi:MAG: hypothetical protein OEY17_07245 [Nitrosopumilus sp.]|nr:hypothetical protein [Nitrosopumilus sp.]MDH5659120.1 hypothetical protein [Nitrosopumilus sp.]
MNDIAVFVNSKIGTVRDNVQLEINEMESWLNEILVQTKNIPKKERCQVCNSREMQYNLEQHHIAGRKHDSRAVTVCRRCHAELSESQKTWDVRWMEVNQSQYVKDAFFLLGLHDVLVLRSKFTANDVCYAIAFNLRQKISDLLQIRQGICA